MADTDVTIVPLDDAHTEAWLRMRETLYEDDRRHFFEEETQQIREEGTLKGQPFACFVALMDDGPVGFAEATVRSSAQDCLTSPVLYLESWYVSAKARGHGVGRDLLEAIERWGVDHGCREIASDTHATNDISAAAHLALGFEDVGVVRCFRKDIRI